eukprot:1577613-Alexandrium_andersonii.AAC.1
MRQAAQKLLEAARIRLKLLEAVFARLCCSLWSRPRSTPRRRAYAPASPDRGAGRATWQDPLGESLEG